VRLHHRQAFTNAAFDDGQLISSATTAAPVGGRQATPPGQRGA
jgi:hypothetical protein